MVKVGKFQKHDFGWAVPLNAIPYGVNAPNRSLWIGQIPKNTAGGATMTFNVRGPTWGFTWIDYCEIHTRCHMGTTLGQARGTVGIVYNQNPTLLLSVTLNFQNRGFLYIVGRTGGRS